MRAVGLPVGRRGGGGGGFGGGSASVPGPAGGAPGVVGRAGASGQAGSGTVDNGTRIRTPQLTLQDAEALVDPTLAPDVVSVAPVVTASSVTEHTN